MLKLMARLPGDKLNGLTRLEDPLLDNPDPTNTFVIVAVVSAGKVEEDSDSGEKTVHVKLRQVEAVLDPGDAESARRIIIRGTEDRMGVRAIEGLDVLLDDWSRMDAIMEEAAKDDDDDDRDDPEA